MRNQAGFSSEEIAQKRKDAQRANKELRKALKDAPVFKKSRLSRETQLARLKKQVETYWRKK